MTRAQAALTRAVDGVNQYGELVGNVCADLNGMGGAARWNRDGEHSIAPIFAPMADIGESLRIKVPEPTPAPAPAAPAPAAAAAPAADALLDAGEHRGRRTERVRTVDDVHGVREAREERRLLHRRVAAADDREAAALDVEHQVLAHHGQADEAEVSLTHDVAVRVDEVVK